MARLNTLNGHSYEVDDEDVARVSEINWSLDQTTGYYRAIVDGKRMSLHRFVTNAPKGVNVDHRNRDKTDNTKENLRFCTQSQNMSNVPLRPNNSTGYIGVHYLRRIDRYTARIRKNYERVYLGCFRCPIEAAKAYDAAALELHGEFAVFNFPQEVTYSVT